MLIIKQFILVPELNAEAFARIKNLQQHDSEIELLANELNVHSYFIKVCKISINILPLKIDI